MAVTLPYKLIGFGAMDVTEPCKFIGFGAMDVTKPYKFIGFGTPFTSPGVLGNPDVPGYARHSRNGSFSVTSMAPNHINL